MKFSTGDRVKFMDEPGGGRVTRIDSKGWVYVETEDGFEIPVTPDKLLRTEMSPPESEDTVSTEKKKEQVPEKNPESPIEEKPAEDAPDTKKETDKLPVLEDAPEIFLALIPSGKRYSCFLVNDSRYQLFYAFGYTDKNVAFTVNEGFLEEDTKIELGIIEPRENRALFLQAILTAERRFFPRPPFDKQIDFGPVQVPSKDHFMENLYFEEDAWLISLLPDRIIPGVPESKKILMEKKDTPKKKLMLRTEISGHEPVEEVDLHIETITDDFARLAPGEILEIQLARFETALEGARHSGQKKIVFIHGLGHGKLKFEIRKILDQKKIRYQDASFKEYGYGATMVMFM
ncbi:MAG: DUF2027 domain-containing protein [Chlorobi bacterium]|nr:DUF2027 domain-containing protein [Chlorobiota bacterium]